MNLNQSMLCIRCCALYICTHLKVKMNVSQLVGKVGCERKARSKRAECIKYYTREIL